MRAAELMGDDCRDELQRLAGSGALLVLTTTRMESLGRNLAENFCGASLSAHNIEKDLLASLAVTSPVRACWTPA